MAKQSLAMMVFMAMVSEGYASSVIYENIASEPFPNYENFAGRVGKVEDLGVALDQSRRGDFNHHKQKFNMACEEYFSGYNIPVPDCDDDALKRSYQAVQTATQKEFSEESWYAMHNKNRILERAVWNQRDKYYKERPEKRQIAAQKRQIAIKESAAAINAEFDRRFGSDDTLKNEFAMRFPNLTISPNETAAAIVTQFHKNQTSW